MKLEKAQPKINYMLHKHDLQESHCLHLIIKERVICDKDQQGEATHLRSHFIPKLEIKFLIFKEG